MGDDKKALLLQFAAEFADQDVDLFDLLGVDALTSKEDIHRAWRKRSLKYHPDKAGDQFDASLWERFERARDVLADPNARAVYDQASKAKLLRKQEREAMDKERKKLADDLEAREGAAMRLRQEKEQRDREAMQRYLEQLAEEKRMHEEEKLRKTEAAQELEDLAEARRRIKARKDEKARMKQAKEVLSKVTAGPSKPPGPDNGVVNVPGEYIANLGGGSKEYWELVCDKLRAMQALRNLQKRGASAEELQKAEEGEQIARQRIHEAEMKYRRESDEA